MKEGEKVKKGEGEIRNFGFKTSFTDFSPRVDFILRNLQTSELSTLKVAGSFQHKEQATPPSES